MVFVCVDEVERPQADSDKGEGSHNRWQWRQTSPLTLRPSDCQVRRNRLRADDLDNVSGERGSAESHDGCQPSCAEYHTERK